MTAATFEILAQGFVSQRDPAGATAVAAGPRCAVTAEGELVCTFMVQSKLGANDFVPMIARSTDGGLSWRDERPIWPELSQRSSLFCGVSGTPSGELFLYGTRTPIDAAGESFWSELTQGLKQNELVWARSGDGGRRWSQPAPIPMPIPGAAEAPGPMCVTRAGAWIVCYAPYNTFDPQVQVERRQVVALRSEDEGRSWRHTTMLRFGEPDSGAAEAWVVELADGRLLGASWHMNHRDGSDYPNAYAMSEDAGRTWTPTRSTGIHGQSTALAALPDGRALFVYNQRKGAPAGVGIAVVRPTPADFGVETNELVWRAEAATQAGGSTGHDSWTDFAFGEPSVTRLRDGSLLLALWCIQPRGRGIAYAKLRIEE